MPGYRRRTAILIVDRPRAGVRGGLDGPWTGGARGGEDLVRDDEARAQRSTLRCAQGRLINGQRDLHHAPGGSSRRDHAPPCWGWKRNSGGQPEAAPALSPLILTLTLSAATGRGQGRWPPSGAW